MMIEDGLKNEPNALSKEEAFYYLEKEYFFWQSRRIAPNGLNRYGCDLDEKELNRKIHVSGYRKRTGKKVAYTRENAYNILYWEIWNEPDLDEDDSTNKRNWGGTKAEFFDFYETVAVYLKSCFPHLKIGGPALAYREDWANDFLRAMREKNVPIDFFSWHIYAATPKAVMKKANCIRSLLDENGYKETESILNEWNYLRGWTDEFVYTIEKIHGIKGAAYVASVITESQRSNAVDMLMYYDTRPSAFNGVFDFYTYRPLKTYYVLKWYGEFYSLCNEIRADNLSEDVYLLCGVDSVGKVTALLTYYSDDEEKGIKEISIDFGKQSVYDIFLLDKDNDGELIKTTSDLSFRLNVNSCLKIKEK